MADAPPRPSSPPAGTAPAQAGLAGLARLAARHSVGPRQLVAPAPSAEELARAVAVALRAPDHRRLRPWRLVRVGDGQREALSGLFAHGARLRGESADGVQRARERAFNGPGLLAVVARVRDDLPEVPAREQWASVGAALMNLLNALHLMGYGAKLLSGSSVDDPPVREAFCAEGETLLCWVLCGTPREPGRPRDTDEPQAAWSDWAGPAPAG